MPDETAVLLELERLRGAVQEGFSNLNGRLDGTLYRTETAEKDIAALESRVSSLERRMWLFMGAGTVLASGGATGLVQLLAR